MIVTAKMERSSENLVMIMTKKKMMMKAMKIMKIMVMNPVTTLSKEMLMLIMFKDYVLYTVVLMSHHIPLLP